MQQLNSFERYSEYRKVIEPNNKTEKQLRFLTWRKKFETTFEGRWIISLVFFIILTYYMIQLAVHGTINKDTNAIDEMFFNIFTGNVVTAIIGAAIVSLIHYTHYGYYIGTVLLAGAIGLCETSIGSIPNLLWIPATGELLSNEMVLYAITFILILFGYLVRRKYRPYFFDIEKYYYSPGMYAPATPGYMALLIHDIKEYAANNWNELANNQLNAGMSVELLREIHNVTIEIRNIRPIINSPDAFKYSFQALYGKEKEKMLADTVATIKAYNNLKNLYDLAEKELDNARKRFFDQQANSKKYYEEQQKQNRQQQQNKNVDSNPKSEYEMVKYMFQDCINDADKIKERFRSLSKTYHPDMKNGNETMYKTICAVKDELLNNCK